MIHPKRGIAIVLALCMILPSLAGCQGDKSNPITAQSIVETLAAEEYRGRFAGSAENERAGQYLAGLFADIGLEPLSGDSYLQPYTQITCDPVKANPRLTLFFADGGSRELIHGEEFFEPTDGSAVDLRLLPQQTESGETASEGVRLFTYATEGNPGGECRFIEDERLLIFNNMFNRAEDSIIIKKGIFNQIDWDTVSEASLQIEATASEQTLHNIVGRIPGKDQSKAVILSAHFDGAGVAGELNILSAVDNASGVATMLTATQALVQKQEDLQTDVLIVAFNGEENSLAGSKAFAADISVQYEEMININLDCIGCTQEGESALDVHSQTLALSGGLNEAMRLFLTENKVMNEYGDYHSDEQSFELQGFPGVGLMQANTYDYMHTAKDTPDVLDYAYIENIGRLTAEFVILNGDNMYTPELTEDEAWEIAQQMAPAIREQYRLAYDEAYKYQVGRFYFTLTNDTGFAPGEQLVWYPNMNPPEILGEYSLKRIAVYNYSRLMQNIMMSPQLLAGDVVDQVYKIDVSDALLVICTYENEAGERMNLAVNGMQSFPENLETIESIPGSEDYYLEGRNPGEYNSVYYRDSDFYMEAYTYKPEEYDPERFYQPRTVLSMDEAKELLETINISNHLEEYRSMIVN